MPEITVPEASSAESAAAVREGGLLLDVREPAEFNAGHIAGSVLMPMHAVPEQLHELTKGLPSGQAVYVICRSGNRSWQVAHYLRHHGVNAINVAGGLVAWHASGLPLAVGATESGPTPQASKG
jgi:rhodanese-related sulfurtransferase